MPPLPAAVDVLVAGAGAAGLMAAAAAAARGRSTLIVEKSQRPGLKILISGGGRCNVTTTRQGDDLERQYGPERGRFLRHALRTLPPVAVRALFEQLAVPLREEDLEKLFPVSQQARDVLQGLLRHAASAGAQLATGAPVVSATHDGAAFVVATPLGTVRAESLVLATGGRSYPKTGATGDGYALCAAFGHTITNTVPALAPLRVEAPWVRALQGIVLQDVDLALLSPAGKVLRQRRRPILFTHKGLSGPAPMDLAGDLEEGLGNVLRFDLLPERTAAELEAEWLARCAQHGQRKVEALLPQHLPERLQRTLTELAGCAGTTLANLGRDARRRLLACVKDLRVEVASSLGFDHAEVTRGGVALREIEPRTMASRLRPGLFVCGELLDVDGPIGGFNFQAAFATGHLAGRSA